MVLSVLALTTLSSLFNAAEVSLLMALLVLTLLPRSVLFSDVVLVEKLFDLSNTSSLVNLELVSLSMVLLAPELRTPSRTSNAAVAWKPTVLLAETLGTVCSVVVHLLLPHPAVAQLTAVTWVLLLVTLLTATVRTLVPSKSFNFKASVLKSVLLAPS